MGQKVSPLLLRLGYIKNWRSLWFADKKDFRINIIEDYKIRKYVKAKFVQASVSNVIIERMANQIKVRIRSARPGIIIGRRGADVDKLKSDLANITAREVTIDIEEIKNPAIDAQLIAQNIALQLEKRVAFRRAMKRSIEQATSSGAQGVKISCSGRLGGAEMSRRETYKVGKLPLQTFRADIDYGFAEAMTTYGILGIKAWVYKGDVILEKSKIEAMQNAEKFDKSDKDKAVKG